ncbi:MAG: winged helix-turn-helix transcriptional regulator [Anaerolineales bacterium]|nr:winged helix-turn-helix transcriptional regulator [Anaerolineales bacterium]
MVNQILQATEIGRSVGIPFVSLLATRVVGKRFFEYLQEYLRQQPSNITVKLSLAGVEVMDASFSDEVFGTFAALRARREITLCPVILTDLNQTCRENLQMALETRIDREPESLERLRNCVLPILDGMALDLIGRNEDHIQESFMLLGKHCRLTARELADILNLNVNAASTRLKTLADLGLAFRIETRDSVGKQYIYNALL